MSTFCTLSNPSFDLPSLSLPTIPQSLRAGSTVVSSTPSISASVPLVGKGVAIASGYSPIPLKLVSKITSGQFVELVDHPHDNLKINEHETQAFLGGKFSGRPT